MMRKTRRGMPFRRAREELGKIDPEFDTRPPEVQKMMVFALTTYGASIIDVEPTERNPGGKAVVFSVGDAPTTERMDWVRLWGPKSKWQIKMEAKWGACQAFPFHLFEDTPEKQGSLEEAVRVQCMPSTGKTVGGGVPEKRRQARRTKEIRHSRRE